eukprot:2006395-Prymnesium_polylepis.1
MAISPATYSIGKDASNTTKTCTGHTDQNNAYKSLQPTLLHVVDLDPPSGASGIIEGACRPQPTACR